MIRGSRSRTSWRASRAVRRSPSTRVCWSRSSPRPRCETPDTALTRPAGAHPRASVTRPGDEVKGCRWLLVEWALMSESLSPAPLTLRSFWHDLPREGKMLLSIVVVEFLGTGLVLPFLVVYLHEIRGFALSDVGLLIGL